MDLFPRKFYLDDIFDDFAPIRKDQSMKCDIYEKEGNYHIVMDVPGFDKKDISMEVVDGYLKISATKNTETNDSDDQKRYIRRERIYGKYERSFYVGDLDQDRIKAEFNNGTLSVEIPKKEETSNKRVIEID